MIACAPGASAAVESVAVPELSAAAPIDTAPSYNAIVPEAAVGVTLAVSVMAVPNVVDAAEVVSVVTTAAVALDEIIVIEATGDVLPL